MRNLEEVSMLLDIMHKTVNVPKLKTIHDIAETELVSMSNKEPSHNELKAQAASFSNVLAAEKSKVLSLTSQLNSLQAKCDALEKELEDARTPAPVPAIESTPVVERRPE